MRKRLKNNFKLRILWFVSLVSLIGCDPAGDWIEVPLEDDTYQPQTVAYQQGQYNIAVPAGEGLEFKLAMKADEVIVYHWAVEMELPALLLAEFHGHTNRQGDEPGTVMFYKIHNSGQEHGSLKAPFDGIHGWYLRNDSDNDVVVHLTVAGYFAEIKE